MRSKTLALLGARSGAPLPSPSDLDAMGRALEAKEIAAEFFKGRVSPRWVLDHVAREKRVRMGRVIVWYERDVKLWFARYIADQQAEATRKAG